MKVRRNPWLRSTGTTCLLFAGGLAAGQAFAQAAPEEETTGLEEIIVSAERREENLQETALSITAMSETTIEKTRAENIRELADFVPNLAITPSQYGDAAPAIVIRGVGGGGAFQSFGAAAERNVAMYVDGLYYPRSFGSIMKVTEVASVEVLRGPQGTLFGRNTTGGAISLQSKKASLSEGFAGYLEAEGGNFGLLNFKGNVNVPLSDSWAMRVGAAKLNRDGHVERGGDPLNDDDTLAASMQFHGEPTDNLTIDAAFRYSDSETQGTPSNFTQLQWNEALAATQLPGDVTAGLRGHLCALSKLLVAAGQPRLQQNDPRLLLGDRDVPKFCILDDTDPFTMGELCDTFNKTEMQVGSIRAVYDINDNFQVTSLTGTIRTDVDTRTDSYYTGAYARDFAQGSRSFQQELQLNMNFDKWHAVTGLVYFNERANEYELTTERVMTSFANTSDTLRTRRLETYDYTTDAFAWYGQGTYKFTSWFDLTGGLRYSEDRKEGRIFLHSNPLLPQRKLASGGETFDAVDWKASAQFRPMQDVMLFVSKSKAFKSGIIDDASAENTNAALPDVRPVLFVDPETVNALEVGVRSEWFDKRLRVNVTYYDQDWEDRHTSGNFNADIPGIGTILVFSTTNDDGIINIKGVELESAFAITDDLTATVNYGLTEAESSEDPEFILDSVPKFNFTAGLDYGFNVFGGKLNTNVSYVYRDKAYSFSVTEPDRDDPGLIKSYGLYNANLTYTPDSGRWSVSVYGRNLTDKEYDLGSFAISGYANVSFIDSGPYTADPRVKFTGQPRTIGATFRYNFGL